MSAKSVWGVVLILLGLLAALSGLKDLIDIAQADQITQDFIFGPKTAKFLGSEYHQAIRQLKIQCAIQVVVGISLCFGGTWMIQDSQPTKKKKSKIPNLPKSPHDWKFMKGEEIDEFIRPEKPVIIPIYSDPKRPEISKARCGSCKKEFTYPTSRSRDLVPCPQCRMKFELP